MNPLFAARQRYLVFHCPCCFRPLDRLIDVGVVKLTLDFRCPHSRDCGKVFRVVFEEPASLRTLPGQRADMVFPAAKLTGYDVIVAQ